MDTKDDPGFKFDDDDDEVLAGMLPDPVTKRRTNPYADSAVATAPVLAVAHVTETCRNVTQGHDATSRVTTNADQNLSNIPTTSSTVAQAHPTTSAVTSSPIQSATLDSETGPGATQAHPTTPSVTSTPGQSVPLNIDPGVSQSNQLPQQPQVSTDQSPGPSGHIADPGTCFQGLLNEEINLEQLIIN